MRGRCPCAWLPLSVRVCVELTHEVTLKPILQIEAAFIIPSFPCLSSLVSLSSVPQFHAGGAGPSNPTWIVRGLLRYRCHLYLLRYRGTRLARVHGVHIEAHHLSLSQMLLHFCGTKTLTESYISPFSCPGCLL